MYDFSLTFYTYFDAKIVNILLTRKVQKTALRFRRRKAGFCFSKPNL